MIYMCLCWSGYSLVRPLLARRVSLAGKDHPGIRHEPKIKRTALHFDYLQDGRGFYFVDTDFRNGITLISDACLQMQ